MLYRQHFRSGYVYLLCCCASLGGVIYGYSTGVIAGVIPFLQVDFQLTPTQIGWVASSILAGGLFGALIAGYVAERIGRKITLLITSIIFVITGYLCMVTESFHVFSFARLVCGFAIGLAATISPMYISEIAPTEIRGKATGTYNLSMIVGVLAVFIVNYLIARDANDAWLVDEGWRKMIGAQLVPSIIMFAVTLFLPESPHWCIKHNRSIKAIKTLSTIYPEFNQKEDNLLFYQNVNDVSLKKSVDKKENKSLSSPVLRYILVVGVLIAVLQQFTGINVMNYYTPLVLQNTSDNQDIIFFQTIFVAVFNGIGGFIGMHLFDKYGRLPIMKLGTIGAILGLLIASAGLYIHDTSYITITGILVFMLFFAMGWGAGAWVLISEIFPYKIKGLGMSLAVSLMWVANFVITLVFPVINENSWLQQQFNGAASMWLFVIFNIACYWFLCRYVPETKGITADKVEEISRMKMQKLYVNKL